ncbi:hypothetical protein AMATHDRAFT_55624 [Amanita thiersii Skay4041]|uniref:Uncharacterized protein n=1 Tax=Amanita thiersii Skay4041 TaxID=703135 RepID=A0A2A9NZ16_9AGAR|nr:hypothetical protein AMATHDRAFT_55624 [Amanita thiersii Skay4041]
MVLIILQDGGSHILSVDRWPRFSEEAALNCAVGQRFTNAQRDQESERPYSSFTRRR